MAKTTLSPLAPPWARGEGERPALPPLAGVSLATAAAGIKYEGRTDLMVMLFDRPVRAAGVFTRSACASAPVEWCRALAGRDVRAVVVNSGNANAFTGTKGAQACQVTAEAAAGALGCAPEEIALASTGVIGEPMDASRFSDLLADLCGQTRPDRWWDAAAAIMTTDTYPKAASRTFEAEGRTYRINGIAKGSGMIAPDMATMLAFLATDAPLAQADMQAALARAADATFNAVSVDSDTSTSDTLMLFATGAGEPLGDMGAFEAALRELCEELAVHLVRDGEGATKQVEVRVEGARSDASAKRIAMSVANSPLVKTAIAGEDANWGRVVMAVGKAGEPADRDRLSIAFGDVRVAVNGERDPHYSEAAASAVMRESEIVIRVDLGLGPGRARVWTCDLTHGYIAINGDYRS